MALETVVGQDAAQIGIAVEDDAEHVPRLALEPAGRGEQRDDGRHGGLLVGVQLHADTLIMLQRQQVVDDLEALFAGRIIDAANIHQLLELAVAVVAQERHHLGDGGGADGDHQFALGDFPGQHVLRQGRGEIIPEVLQGLRHGISYLAMVPVRRIFFCSCSTP